MLKCVNKGNHYIASSQLRYIYQPTAIVVMYIHCNCLQPHRVRYVGCGKLKYSSPSSRNKCSDWICRRRRTVTANDRESESREVAVWMGGRGDRTGRSQTLRRHFITAAVCSGAASVAVHGCRRRRQEWANSDDDRKLIETL